MHRSSVQEPALSQPGNEMSEKNYWLMAADQIPILGPMCSDPCPQMCGLFYQKKFYADLLLTVWVLI